MQGSKWTASDISTQVGGVRTPPINLHEYQRKGLTEITFRKRLILKNAISVVLGLQDGTPTLKTKSGVILHSLLADFYRVKCISK